MFEQSQMQFKEAFNMTDQNRDGFTNKEDLHGMLVSLGKNPTIGYLDAMMNEAPGPINFTMVLTMSDEEVDELYREAPTDKRGISITSSSHASLNMEEKSKTTERTSNSGQTSLIATLRISEISSCMTLALQLLPFLLSLFSALLVHASL
ncbi:Myosin regulatory light chain 12B [Tupaia chinensis]|uniref:Myosin regulatory light chain 12B n=1 Tax=Tupaia chinensis TaxID=246437 RepID=L9L6V6_TUPCH|nr:Myosin regulatory light chain 12B [Tupaia chinensis]